MEVIMYGRFQMVLYKICAVITFLLLFCHINISEAQTKNDNPTKSGRIILPSNGIKNTFPDSIINTINEKQDKAFKEILLNDKDIMEDMKRIHLSLTISLIVFIINLLLIIYLIILINKLNKKTTQYQTTYLINKDYQNILNNQLLKIFRYVVAIHSNLFSQKETPLSDNSLQEIKNEILPPSIKNIDIKIGVKVNNDFVEETEIADYFYIKPPRNGIGDYELFLHEKIIQSRPNSTHDTNIKKAFNLERNGSEKYQLVEPAKVEWETASHSGLITKKGSIILK